MFTIDIDLINNDSTNTETYMVSGQIWMSSQTNVSLAPTGAHGGTIFHIGIFSQMDSGDGVSVQVKSADGNNVGSAFTYIKP